MATNPWQISDIATILTINDWSKFPFYLSIVVLWQILLWHYFLYWSKGSHNIRPDTHCMWFSRSSVRGPVTNCKHRQSTKSTTTAGLIVEHVNLGSLRAHGVRSFMFFAGKVDPTRLFCGQWPRRKRGKVKIREIAWFHLSLSLWYKVIWDARQIRGWFQSESDKQGYEILLSTR